MKIKSRAITSQAMFTKYGRFTIPKFQRSYCWKPNAEVAQLVSDLLDDLSVNDNGKIVVSNYYIGQILVRQKDKRDPCCQVIDGQQRLTTMLLIFQVLRKELGKLPDPNSDEKVANLLSTLQQLIWDGDHLRIENQEFPAEFLHLFRRPESNLCESQPEKKPFEKAYDYLAALLRPAKLRKLVRSRTARDVTEQEALVGFTRQCLATKITLTLCRDSDGINQVFETLNYRGKPLGQIDLIMNSLFVKSDSREDVRGLFQQMWEKQINSKETSSDVFARHFLETITGKAVGKKRIYHAYKRHARETSFSVGHFMDQLSEFGDYYRKAAAPALIPLKKDHMYLVDLMRFLETLKIEMARPVLASLLKFYDSHADAFDRCKELLEYLCVFHLFFTGAYSQRTNSIAGPYRLLAKEIYYAATEDDFRFAFTKFKEKVISKLADKAELANCLDGFIYSAKTQTKAKLIKQNACSKFVVQFISKRLDHSKRFAESLSIEHVFGNSNEQHISYVIPLSENENNAEVKSASSLEEKIPIYARSQFKYSRDFANRVIEASDYSENNVKRELKNSFDENKECLMTVLFGQ